MNRTILVTGGAGFIGSNFVRYILETYPGYAVINLDKLTYAGNPANLADIADSPRYEFVHGDIADPEIVNPLVERADCVVNFAAQSHVDRSIHEAREFLRTNIDGVYTLLEAAKNSGVERFVHISTDEVYGQVMEGTSGEDDALAPRNPYSASKAGGELLARSYFVTYDLPVMITRGSNTIGPFQYPEKVVPLFVTNAIEDKPMPIYGSGTAVRDYMHVIDHCRGIDHVLHNGEPGEYYNIGAGNEVNTIELATAILNILGKPESLIKHVQDRPGHDMRYALGTEKLRAAGWQLKYSFEETLTHTVTWYQDNPDWWKPIKSGEFARWYAEHYKLSDNA